MQWAGIIRLSQQFFSVTHLFLLQASAPLASQDVAGPPVLPSTFLREAVAGFLDRLRAHQVGVTGERQGAAGCCLLHQVAACL